MTKLSEDAEKQQKDILWHQSAYNAWFETRMEADKQVLTLSGLGIGLLMTFKDKLTIPCTTALWCAAAACFLISIFLILRIFSKNSDYLQIIVQNEDGEKQGKTLKLMTGWAHWLFFVGAFLTVALALRTIVFA